MTSVIDLLLLTDFYNFKVRVTGRALPVTADNRKLVKPPFFVIIHQKFRFLIICIRFRYCNKTPHVHLHLKMQT